LQSLRKLHAKLQRAGASGADSQPPLTWLFDCGGIPSDSQLDAFATYGQGIAPEKVQYTCSVPTPAKHLMPKVGVFAIRFAFGSIRTQHFYTLQGLLEELRPVAACGKPPANSCSPAGPHCAGSMAAPPGSNAAAPDIDLVRRAAARGLYVHPWTVRQEVSAGGSCRCKLVC
jgi:glycerophosphoryl diester phosphodiesterase